MPRDLDGFRSEASTDEHDNRARLNDHRSLSSSRWKKWPVYDSLRCLQRLKSCAQHASFQRMEAQILPPRTAAVLMTGSSIASEFATLSFLTIGSAFLQHVTLSHLRLAIHSLVPPTPVRVIALNLHTPQDLSNPATLQRCNPADPQTNLRTANEFKSLSKPTQSQCSKLDLH